MILTTYNRIVDLRNRIYILAQEHSDLKKSFSDKLEKSESPEMIKTLNSKYNKSFNHYLDHLGVLNSLFEEEGRRLELFMKAKKITGKQLSRLIEKSDRIPGGKADNKKESDFDPKQLAMGIEVETEHTKDRGLAKEIAMDHLTEIPDYYTRLKKMEDEAKRKEEGEDENPFMKCEGVKNMYRNAGITPPKGKGIHTKKFHEAAVGLIKEGYPKDSAYAIAMSRLGKKGAVNASHRR